MNYATLEEAWGKDPLKISSEQRMHAALDKHPLMKASGVPSLPTMKGIDYIQEECATDKERRHEEMTTKEQVMHYVDAVYERKGIEGVKALLPRRVLLAMGLNIDSKVDDKQLDMLPMEDVAKWILIALIFVLLLDIIRS